MTSTAVVGLLIMAFIVVGGMLLTAALASAAFGLRRRMFERATELLRTPGLQEDDRLFVEYCMDNALNFHAGWLPLRAIWGEILSRDESAPDGRGHPRHAPAVTSVGFRFILSVLVANPLAAILFAPSVLILMLVEREAAKPAIRQTAVSLTIDRRPVAA